MQASQTLADTEDMYSYLTVEGESLRQSQLSERMKAKSMCLPGKEFHLQSNLNFYKYSMSKGH